VAFDAPAAPVTARCLVIYPDGTMTAVSDDPLELLTEARTERAEAKRLLRDALDASDKLERAVRIEGDLAREKLTARLEKYSMLVDDSVAGAAKAARDEFMAEAARSAEDARKAGAAVAAMLEEAKGVLEAVREVAEKSAERAAEGLKRRSAKIGDAVSEMAALRNEARDFRDEARNAAANAEVNMAVIAAANMNAALEEIRAVKAAAKSETEAVLNGVRAEMTAMNAEARASKDEARRAIAGIAAMEKRCAEIDAATRDRETGMRALSERIRRKERSGENA
jgi:hypothetical protein